MNVMLLLILVLLIVLLILFYCSLDEKLDLIIDNIIQTRNKQIKKGKIIRN